MSIGGSAVGSLCLVLLAITTGASCVAAVADSAGDDVALQADAPAQEHARVRVLTIHFDPVDANDQSLSQRYQWANVRDLTWQHRADMYHSSGQAVAIDVVAMRTVREFPPLLDDDFTLENYHSCLGVGGDCVNATRTDYERMIRDQGLCHEVAAESIDEVWLFGGPGFGFFESRMIGSDAFHVNSAPLAMDGANDGCTRPFVIMGFNISRTPVEMLHNFGHRVDDTLAYYADNPVNGLDPSAVHVYKRSKRGILFAGCGTTHNPPNVIEGKEGEGRYGEHRTVASVCDSVGPVPNDSVSARTFDCTEWECQESQYHQWRFGKLPRAKQANWWRLLFPQATWAEGEATYPKPLPPIRL